MKKRILLTCLLTSFSFLLSPLSSLLSAQVPHSFSYQAVVRGNNGEPIAYQNTNFRISLLLGSDAGPTSYQETHLQTTNFFGLVNLQIGNGTVVTGVFDTLSWSSKSYYIKVEADTSGGSNFIALGTTQLLAVPYALHAEDASSAASSTMIRDSDDETKITTELIPDDNQIRFYTGGQERLRLTGTRLEMTSGNILIGGESGKAITSGGGNVFIGDSTGACNTEGSINTFLGTWSGAKNTTGNSNTFIGFLSGNDNTTGSSNTFIGMLSGRHNTTGYVNTFLGMFSGRWNTSGNNNTFTGYESGHENTTGERNTFLGTISGHNNQTGSGNVYLGYAAGFNNQTGEGNVFIGNSSGFDEMGSNRLIISNRSYDPLISGEFDNEILRFWARRIEVKNNNGNTILGDEAGINTTGGGNVYIGTRAAILDYSGVNNVYIGMDAGYNNYSGSYNVFLGPAAGANNTTGARNTFTGAEAGHRNTTGERNTFVGWESGDHSNTGNDNTYLGAKAGQYATGSHNVFIGSHTGENEEMASNKLYIANSGTSEPLIYGDFAEKKLKFWADSVEASGEIRSNQRFNVNGNAGIQDTLNHITAFDFVNDKLKYRTTFYTGGIVTWLSEESDWVDAVGDPILPPYVCGQIGMVGEFNEWGGEPDHEMTSDFNNPNFWTTIIKITPSDDISDPPDNIVESKFRENQNWDVNWGSFEFPTGTGYQGYGNNIPVALNGAYDTTIYYVTFNCETGAYTFEDLSGYCLGPITDSRDGQQYETVLIGNKCWMAENLNIGTRIDGVSDQTDNGTIEKYCYDDIEGNCDDFGGFYQWNEAMQYTTTEGSQGICPDGWHIPTDQELKTLEGMADSQYGVGNPQWDLAGCRGFDAGTNLKSTTGWETGCNGTDIAGFNALPSGYRNVDGLFISNGNATFIWSSSQRSEGGIWPRNFSCSELICRDFDTVEYGWSVRCIKN